MPRAKLVYLLTALLCLIPAAIAQEPQPDPHHIDASAFGERIDISSTWLFSPTDNPEFASPRFDDRSWPVISTRRGLSTYGFHDLGTCWYRMHVHLPSSAQNVVLVLASTSSEYQAFVNGVQIAGPTTIGGSYGHGVVGNVNYRIPDSLIRTGKDGLVLALRFAPSRGLFRPEDPMQYAEVHLVSSDAAPRDASYMATHAVAPFVFDTAVSLLAALVSLSLYLAIQMHPEYLAAAIFLGLRFGFGTLLTYSLLRPTTSFVWLFAYVLTAALYLSLAEFVRIVLSRQHTRLILTLEAFIFVGTILGNFVPEKYFGGGSAAFWLFTPSLVLDLVLLMLLIPAWHRRNVDAFVLLPVLTLSFVDDFWLVCSYTLSQLNHPVRLPRLPSLHVASYVFSFNDLSNLFIPLAILFFLVVRTVRIARERERATAELQSAQTMQRLLLARSSEPTPGFNIESVYLPANEVGGDFFLVSPDPHNGSLTAILGDVSGKGLTAAMRVAIILGVLRREDARDPATILLRLNQALLSQGDIGFTTACCVRLQSDGAFTLANAGHISPYVDGRELEAPPALPLGIAADQEYPELSGQLGTGARMVLMSDGVVEARSKSGELYGFERLNGLTLKPAQEIAATAQAFGQDDDITVLTLACRS